MEHCDLRFEKRGQSYYCYDVTPAYYYGVGKTKREAYEHWCRLRRREHNAHLSSMKDIRNSLRKREGRNGLLPFGGFLSTLEIKELP